VQLEAIFIFELVNIEWQHCAVRSHFFHSTFIMT